MFSLGKGGATSTTNVSILTAIWNGSNSKVGNETKEKIGSEMGMNNSKRFPKESHRLEARGSGYGSPLPLSLPTGSLVASFHIVREQEQQESYATHVTRVSSTACCLVCLCHIGFVPDLALSHLKPLPLPRSPQMTGRQLFGTSTSTSNSINA